MDKDLDKQYQAYKKALNEALEAAASSRPMHEDEVLRACKEAFQAGYRAGYPAGSQQGYAILDGSGCSGSDFYDDEPWVGHDCEWDKE